MNPQFAVHIVGQALMATFWVCAPLLVISFVLSILINFVQIATSMQDPVFSTVPRLAACFVGFILLLPWMLNHAVGYAVAILGDLGRFAH